MKKLVKALAGVCVQLALASPVQAADTACDTTVKTSSTATGSAQIRFRKVMYNYPSTGKSTWFYTIKSGKKPAVSHIVIGLSSCVGVTQMGTWTTYTSGWSSYSLASKGTDPTCGLYGIKFDQEYDDNEARNIYIVVNGNYEANSSGAMSIKASTTCSQVTVCVPSCQALPVSLLSFDATAEQSHVNLSWTTTTETDMQAFVIERSYDGVAFTEIATIEATGYGRTHTTYSFTDRQAGHEKTYYRLKEQTNTGYVHLLGTATVTLTNTANPEHLQVTAYPNPFAASLNLSVAAADGPLTVEMTDMKGNRVFAQTFAADQPTLQLNNLENLASGVYLIRLITERSINHTQVVKN